VYWYWLIWKGLLKMLGVLDSELKKDNKDKQKNKQD